MIWLTWISFGCKLTAPGNALIKILVVSLTSSISAWFSAPSFEPVPVALDALPELVLGPGGGIGSARSTKCIVLFWISNQIKFYLKRIWKIFFLLLSTSFVSSCKTLPWNINRCRSIAIFNSSCKRSLNWRTVVYEK